MEEKTFENLTQKSRWQVWKEAPWFRWYRSRLTNVRESRKQFIPMRWHFRFGRWENVGLFPFYKGNLAKVFDFFQWDVTWKSKYDFPRFEYNPMISIVFFWTWRAPGGLYRGRVLGAVPVDRPLVRRGHRQGTGELAVAGPQREFDMEGQVH